MRNPIKSADFFNPATLGPKDTAALQRQFGLQGGEHPSFLEGLVYPAAKDSADAADATAHNLALRNLGHGINLAAGRGSVHGTKAEAITEGTTPLAGAVRSLGSRISAEAAGDAASRAAMGDPRRQAIMKANLNGTGNGDMTSSVGASMRDLAVAPAGGRFDGVMKLINGKRAGVVRDAEIWDTLLNSSDRAGEIEAVMEAKKDKPKTLGEMAATHPLTSGAVGSALGTVGGIAAGAGIGSLIGGANAIPLGMLTGGVGGGLLGHFGTNALVSGEQDKLVGRLDDLTPEEKAKVIEAGDKGAPNALGLASGIPYVGGIAGAYGLNHRGRESIADRLAGKEVSWMGRHPRLTQFGLGIPAAAAGAAIIHQLKNASLDADNTFGKFGDTVGNYVGAHGDNLASYGLGGLGALYGALHDGDEYDAQGHKKERGILDRIGGALGWGALGLGAGMLGHHAWQHFGGEKWLAEQQAKGKKAPAPEPAAAPAETGVKVESATPGSRRPKPAK